ncbi:MAG TPA: hypothetical protein PLT83_01110 [Thermoleophilia bacterium]|nr:hypothetical protein [Thermoleophilia bacterium]HQG54076.1 hypothetical protein [Thermoleophilia bacterium]
MAQAATPTGPKIVVVPRPLVTFFFARLQQRYAGRDDVQVIVDRRVGERRRADRYVCGPNPLSDRRRQDRRHRDAAWSLPDMPLSVS